MDSAHARLSIIAGKGGVGKTAVATALALSYARRGYRTLLAEVNARNQATALLEAPPTDATMREVLENLFVVDMNPRDAIHEYALMIVRFEALYRLVFENRVVRRFLRLVPSLNELVMLGKLWFHEQERVGDRPRFDRLVLDAPATGHAIALLRAPQVVYDTVPPGPLRDNARNIHALLSDPQRTVMHVVTTPEEMPVNEAGELADAAHRILNIRLATTFINQAIDPLPDEALARLDPLLHEGELAHVVHSLRLRESKRHAGEAQLARLPAALRHNSLRLPRLAMADFGRRAVETLADILAAAQETRA